jgi:hypothetical protein
LRYAVVETDPGFVGTDDFKSGDTIDWMFHNTILAALSPLAPSLVAIVPNPP